MTVVNVAKFKTVIDCTVIPVITLDWTILSVVESMELIKVIVDLRPNVLLNDIVFLSNN
jgi:hypothetical protein